MLAILLALETVNVRSFGAIGDGKHDDTAAINKAIASLGVRGGSVKFPKGNYLVSIDKADRSRPAIVLKSGVHLKGMPGATIKLADRQGDFSTMLGGFPSWEPLKDVSFRGLTFDANGPNNPLDADKADLGYAFARNTIRIFPGEKFEVKDCQFLNSVSTNTITFNGGSRLRDVRIIGNTFKNIGGNPVDFDHSTIYTNGSDMVVSDNTFVSRSGCGTNGARTAIEIHGANQVVEGNVIDGFHYGVNVTGFSDIKSKGQIYRHNVIRNVRCGFVLWSYKESGLSDILISSNKVTLNVDGWNGFYNQCSGVETEANGDADMSDIRITDNEFRFTSFKTPQREAWHYGGLVIYKYKNPNVKFTNWRFDRNQIIDSIGAPVYLGGNTEGFLAEGNVVSYTKARDLAPTPRSGEDFVFAKETMNADRVNHSGAEIKPKGASR
jgi:hypothetical protein